MKLITSIITSLCLVSASVSAQKARTYLGHGNLFELNYQGYVPLFTRNDFYEIEGNELNTSKNKQFSIHSGLQLSYTRHIHKRISLGVEFGVNRMYYAERRYYEQPNGGISLFVSGPNAIRINSYIGKFEFGSREGIFPIGINHQVGFGLLTAQFLEKNGDMKLVDGTQAVILNYETTWKNIQGYTAFYDLNFRVPLSDRLLLNFGFRYNFNWFPYPDVSSISANDIDPFVFRSEMNQSATVNLIRLHTGLGFSF
ncbi:MAG: hypothetical protein E6Q37_07320 [Crocinitomicaceae bacterium]|nr:MAG: hypothetical protein E6Q37_07320 [Crocinitomicaceae bacterium]